MEDGVAGALEDAGLNLFSVEMIVLTGCGWIADGMETTSLSLLLPVLKDDWSLSSGNLATLSATASVGQAVGAVVCGAAADVFGRRRSFVWSLAVVGIFGLASAFARSFATYAALRACMGLGVGGSLSVAVTSASA